MSLDAFGDEGDINDPAYDAGYEAGKDEGFADGWEKALERVARMIETGYPTGPKSADAHAIAMTVRSLKTWTNGEPPSPDSAL